MHNYTACLYLFINFCNVSVDVSLTICDLLWLSNCFSPFIHGLLNQRYIITICLLFTLTSYGKLFFRNLIQLLLVCSGGIELNPGPKTKNQVLFSLWNLNGLAAHNFTKVSLLQALSVTHDYNITCLSETFLDSPISNEDERIYIEDYNLLKADHPSNKKRGGGFACITRNSYY